jgi:hypothetical protein
MSDHSLPNEQVAIDAVIEAAESQGTIAYAIGGHLTIGYGYDLAELNSFAYTDFLGIGITLDSNELSEIELTNYSQYSIPADISSITISATDETTLLHDAENETWGTVLASAQTALANTQELVAIEDLGYNVPARGATAAQYLLAGNRAQAWFYVRFLANGLYSPGVDPTQGAGGIAARRYMESQVLDLYGPDVDSSGSGNPDFSTAETFAAFSEVLQIFQQYSEYRTTIISYDTLLSPYISNANSKYHTVLESNGLNIPSIETTEVALAPAFDYLVKTYAEGVYIPGYSAEYVATGLGVDQFNIYVDAASTELPSQGQDAVVSFTPAYAGNYFLLGYGLFQTLQGAQGITNVIIAPDGGDTIDPGSANDVVWGAPSATDQNGGTLPGSVLDLSGTSSGAKKLYGSIASVGRISEAPSAIFN